MLHGGGCSQFRPDANGRAIRRESCASAPASPLTPTSIRAFSTVCCCLLYSIGGPLMLGRVMQPSSTPGRLTTPQSPMTSPVPVRTLPTAGATSATTAVHPTALAMTLSVVDTLHQQTGILRAESRRAGDDVERVAIESLQTEVEVHRSVITDFVARELETASIPQVCQRSRDNCVDVRDRVGYADSCVTVKH